VREAFAPQSLHLCFGDIRDAQGDLMSVWEREHGGTTRGQIVALLRAGHQSVDELAHALGLTDNAVRAHLAVLQREQIVQSVGVRREGSVGKPASIYAIAPGAQPLFSRAYSPLLAALLTELRAHATPSAMRKLLKRAGKRMLPGGRATGALESRARAASNLLNELGGSTRVEREANAFIIRGNGCPLSEAVVACPEICGAVEQMLTDLTGARVTESCDRNGPPNCKFRVSTPS
jgi:predicted ArsR family transcriptional regulator